ncbi:MAG: hypothetical protein MW689_000155 [Thermodesulfobacteria bacterium]|nr:hypothetical protein [Thermodesulfobacteriota bacterium]
MYDEKIVITDFKFGNVTVMCNLKKVMLEQDAMERFARSYMTQMCHLLIKYNKAIQRIASLLNHLKKNFIKKHILEIMNKGNFEKYRYYL